MIDQPDILLNSGARMPQVGFGTYKVAPDETVAAVRAALSVGYRSIDTATMYGNEAAVGDAIKESGVAREDVFVTTKLNNDAHGYDNALHAFETSRKALGLDVVDLYLIHWPLPDLDLYVDTWRALVRLRDDGVIASIGVSNFQPDQLDRIIDATGVTPAVNQVELHPYNVQEQIREYDTSHGIATEAWSPLARGGELLADPVIDSLAQKYGKTPAQLVIRWHLDLGTIVIPKSVTPARIAENFDVFDVELDPEDVEAILGLDRGQRVGRRR